MIPKCLEIRVRNISDRSVQSVECSTQEQTFREFMDKIEFGMQGQIRWMSWGGKQLNLEGQEIHQPLSQYLQGFLHNHRTMTVDDLETTELQMVKMMVQMFQGPRVTKEIYNTNWPKYRIVCPGLNFKAVCKTKSCEAYGKFTWVQKGFGHFNVRRELRRCQCPICGEETEQATTIGYYRTRIEMIGMGKQMKVEEMSWSETVTPQQILATFEVPYNDLSEWTFLEITTKELK